MRIIPLPSDSLCRLLVYYHSGCKQACQSHQQGHMRHHTDLQSRQPAAQKTTNINKMTELIFETKHIGYWAYLSWSSQHFGVWCRKYWNNMCKFIYQLTANLRSMKWYFCFLPTICWLHAAIRIAIFKHSWSISRSSSKIFLILTRFKEIRYGRVLRTHSLL